MIKRIGALVFALTLLFSFAVPASAADDVYTFYEYLESDGTTISYVDLNYYPTNNTGFWLDMQKTDPTSGNTQAAGCMMGEYTSSSDYYYFQLSITFNQISLSKSGLSSVNVIVADPYERFEVSLDHNNNYVIDGTSGNLGQGSAFNAALPMYLFALHDEGSVTHPIAMRCYGLKLYEGTVLKRDLVPASNSSGTYGMYDTENAMFYPAYNSSTFVVGEIIGGTGGGSEVTNRINELNSQIHEIENTIYEDLHTYSAQVDPSSATNFSGNFLSAMSFISDTWTSAYNQLGDMQVIVTFPLFLAIAMLFIGRMNSVIASGAMKSRKNNDKKGGGDVG